jgi:beta-lactamase class A
MKARPLLLIPILAACAGDSLALNADVRLHAASTMKVPAMIQVFRDARAGWFNLEDSIPIRNTFRSIADQSPYQLSLTDDSDSTLYARIGQRASVRELTELMITVSSNLAANVLIELVGAERVQHSMRELGADSIAVLRGVEDIEAYEAGLNNTTTARDLGIILTAIAEARAADEASCREMLDILARQMFNDGIPAGLPDGTRVAHKTGLITRINHDTAVVELPSGRRYVLVVLVRGIEDPSESDILVADISRIVYERVLIAE